MELFISGASAKKEPQMNADERRFNVPGLYRRGAGSLPAGLCQWRRTEGRGLGVGERGAQVGWVLGGMIFPYFINVWLSLSYFFG
jgi:hypothetical protein